MVSCATRTASWDSRPLDQQPPPVPASAIEMRTAALSIEDVGQVAPDLNHVSITRGDGLELGFSYYTEEQLLQLMKESAEAIGGVQ